MEEDCSLLGRALSCVSQRAQTVESLAAELDMSVQDVSIYWFAVNELRRCQGRSLPVPLGAALPVDPGDVQYFLGNWYSFTWRLGALLEAYQINEGLAVHYEHILSDPEGGHYELNLAAGEVVLALELENTGLDAARMKRVCVQACEPASGIELLAANAGKILLTIEEYRSTPINALFIETLYAKLVAGISIKEVHEKGECKPHALDEKRHKALESFCANLWPLTGSESGARVDFPAPTTATAFATSVPFAEHTLISALIALHYFKTFHLFSAGNGVFAYVMYFLILHRAGYHFSAHIPVVKLLYARESGANQGHCLTCIPEDLTVECNGYHDWTCFFECAVELVVEEQRWTMTKLEGMSRRRERFRIIIDADETLNFRQKEVLLEAALHSNAEFTYAIHERRYDVSYPCARSDFARLVERNFLVQCDDGIRHFFVACDTFNQVFVEYAAKHCPQIFYHYYHEDGCLRNEYRSAEDAATSYNKDVLFYEKSLLDRTYIEHHNSRREFIADSDGPHRRNRRRSHVEPTSSTS